MGIPAWVWFVIAAVAAVAGVALLLRDRARRGGGINRERSRWAALRGWQYVEGDDQLLEHWAGGAIAYYPGGVARDVVIGSAFTANGRRPVYVADSVHDGATDFVLVAVRCRRRLEAYLELWLPSVPFRRDQMPDLLGPVGQRYAFVSDVEATRSLITSDLADAAEQVGDDVNVVWLEGYWVVAAAPPNCSSARLERLLRDLGDLADLADPIENARSEPAGAPPDQQPGDPQPGETERQRPSQPQATQSARAAQAAQASTQAGTAAQATPHGQAEPSTQRVNADEQRDPRR
ncbi:MAG: hypothetical protein ACRDQ5_02085, partial [Sciscionella sp.]